MDFTHTVQEAKQRWPVQIETRAALDRLEAVVECDAVVVPDIAAWLFDAQDYSYCGLVVEERASQWELRHIFHRNTDAGWLHLLARQPLSVDTFPSISTRVHAADWHEREAEDMFGLKFDGHPRLGDFILHDDAWQEGVAPMRKQFDAAQAYAQRQPRGDWAPRRIVHANGSFVMPIGPIYSGVSESAHFILETVGEDVIRAFPRLFYKYRAVEKTAEGRSVEETLPLAERFAATTAFAHALAFCQAAEAIGGIEVPPRAQMLRALFAELERVRHHGGAIQEICESTALVVATNQASILEEELLRVCGALSGHRYLFGLTTLGGLTLELRDDVVREAVARVDDIVARLQTLEQMLRVSSSFLDRLEEVGVVTQREARDYGLVGPLARACGVARDLRKVQPYGRYADFEFEVPREIEGDGYARLRVLFAEARESWRIMHQIAGRLPSGPVLNHATAVGPGAAVGWVEAPRGAAFHWLRIDDDGKVARYHVVTPSFINWHSFHLAAEKFAFQDFPIILASFGLSVAENDR